MKTIALSHEQLADAICDYLTKHRMFVGPQMQVEIRTDLVMLVIGPFVEVKTKERTG